MSKDFKLMVLANAVFVALYVFFNWVEYSSLNLSSYSYPSIRTRFPLYFAITSYHPPTGAVVYSLVPNFNLMIFLVAISLNTYFIIRLQRGKRTKSIKELNN
jgi:hypothetical protein